MLLLSACVNTVKFPVSSVAPAADIVATKKTDKNGNYLIKVKAINLAAATRLNPPKEAYYVWISTDENGIRNTGKLIMKNAKTASLETLTPFSFREIFITAEDNGDISFPYGVEISRARFGK